MPDKEVAAVRTSCNILAPTNKADLDLRWRFSKRNQDKKWKRNHTLTLDSLLPPIKFYASIHTCFKNVLSFCAPRYRMATPDLADPSTPASPVALWLHSFETPLAG